MLEPDGLGGRRADAAARGAGFPGRVIAAGDGLVVFEQEGRIVTVPLP